MHDIDLLRIALSLILVLGLIVAAAWFVRRFQGTRRGGQRRITVLDVQSLGSPKTQLVVAQVDNTTLVLGVTAQQVSLLHTLPASAAPDASAQPAANTAAFADTLSHAFRRSQP